MDIYSRLINSKYEAYDGPLDSIVEQINEDMARPVVDHQMIEILNKSKFRLNRKSTKKMQKFQIVDHLKNDVKFIEEEVDMSPETFDIDSMLTIKEEKYFRDFFIELRFKNYNKKLSLEYFFELIQAIQNTKGKMSHSKKSEYLLELFSFDLSLNEKMFILDVITKNLKFGASLNTFHKIFAEFAKQNMFSRQELKRYEFIFNNSLTDSTKLDYFVEPMLSNNAVSLADLEKRLHYKKTERVLVEDKFDGERIQVHISRDQLSDSFKIVFFSRGGENNTMKYSSLLDEINQAFADLPITSAIFDGEIIPFDFQKNEVQGFQHIKSYKNIDQNQLDISFLIMIFDIISCNGEDVGLRPILERKDLLGQIFKHVQSPKIQQIKHTEIEFSSEAKVTLDSFLSAIRRKYELSKVRNNEGLIVKSKTCNL